jgi:CheY-like chemotaxis protein
VREQTLQVLLVEPKPERIRLMEEAVAELEERRYSRGWLQSYELTLAVDGGEAAELAAQGSFDAALVDISGEETEPLPEFLKLRAAAPELPILLLAEAADEGLALSLVRQGAQDYLLLEELDCWPLAKMLRTAMERQKLWRARQSISLTDELTGLYNERGFRHLANQHARIGARLGHPLLLAAVSMGTSGADADLADLDFLDTWRSSFEPTDLTARVGPGRFAAAALVASDDEALALESKLARMDPAPAVQLLRPAVCAEGIEDAMDSLLAPHRRFRAATAAGLCETGVFEDRARRHV